LSAGARAKHLNQSDLKNCKNLEGVKLIAFLGSWQFTVSDRLNLELCLRQYQATQRTTLYFQFLDGAVTENYTLSENGLGGGYPFGARLKLVNGTTKVTIPGLVGPYAQVTARGLYGRAVLAPEPLSALDVRQLLRHAGVHQWVDNSAVEVSGDRILLSNANPSSTTTINNPYLLEIDEFDPQTGLTTRRCTRVTSCKLPPTGRYSRLLYVSKVTPGPTSTPTGLVRFEYQPGIIGGALGAAVAQGGVTYCAINSGEALQDCGYTSEQYMGAPLISFPGSQSIKITKTCSCP
jgi:hypothetical protein